jgi:hypothetical protein
MKILKAISILSAVATIAGNGIAVEAQGFSALLEKLDQLETRLDGLESSQTREFEAMQKELASANGPEGDGFSHSVTQLKEQLGQYAGELETIKAETDRLVTVEDVEVLTTELRDLVGTLRQTVRVEEEVRVAEKPAPAEKSSIPAKTKPATRTADPGKVSGYMFGDYYYLSRASGHSIGAVKGDLEENSNGFAFRRIYLEYNRKLNAETAVRLRLETGDAGFGAGSKMEPFVKHAYVKYASSGRTVYLGLAGTPTWSVSEKMWGYRSIEKTIMDLHKIGSSADLGVAVKSKLGKGMTLQLMLGNGPGQKPEKDNHKKAYLQLSIKPTPGLTVVGYSDWESQPAGKDKVTLAGFIGLGQSKLRGGLEGFMRVNRQGGAEEDIQVRGISLFGSVKGSSRVRAFGRFDLFDPSDQTTDDQEYLATAGVDFTPQKDFHLMPNLWLQAYQASGMETDIVPRMTIYYKF